jgi:hypothetical protein
MAGGRREGWTNGILVVAENVLIAAGYAGFGAVLW